MKSLNQRRALEIGVEAAHAAGRIMQKNFRSIKVINETQRYDIKLELDVRCQETIAKTLRRKFPDFGLFGEEGTTGDSESKYRWVVDPIDGTVNFAHEIPHAAVSIALQRRVSNDAEFPHENYQTIIGVIYDPFVDELFTAIRGRSARLNGKPIYVSARSRLSECIITMGFAKNKASLDAMLPVFQALSYKVRKIRLMGSAALALAYLAAGRLDAYLESSVRLWDIAAGGLIVECAGGDFYRRPIGKTEPTYQITVNNGRLRSQLERVVRAAR